MSSFNRGREGLASACLAALGPGSATCPCCKRVRNCTRNLSSIEIVTLSKGEDRTRGRSAVSQGLVTGPKGPKTVGPNITTGLAKGRARSNASGGSETTSRRLVS